MAVIILKAERLELVTMVNIAATFVKALIMYWFYQLEQMVVIILKAAERLELGREVTMQCRLG